MKWLKRAGYALLVLLVLAAGGYWWLLIESRASTPDRYPIDLAQIRRLAEAVPGAKPSAIRIETVAELGAPSAITLAGTGFQHVDLPVSSYELVFPDRSIIVDTGLNEPMGKAMSGTSFDQAAYARMSAALGKAALIVLTHEHPDHLGGLLAQPDLTTLLPATRLTREQVETLKANLDTDAFKPLHVPASVFAGYRPLAYGRYQAIAPGVVLIKAPGHTPGSQMVYVRRADGAEALLLGDVAWRMPGVEGPREKSRLAAWMSGENRGQVRDELAALHLLHAEHPELHMMPGHDAVAIDTFVKGGWLVRGF